MLRFSSFSLIYSGIKWDLDGLNGFGGISLVTEYIWGYNRI